MKTCTRICRAFSAHLVIFIFRANQFCFFFFDITTNNNISENRLIKYNFVKSEPLRSRIFKIRCNKIGSSHEVF